MTIVSGIDFKKLSANRLGDWLLLSPAIALVITTIIVLMVTAFAKFDFTDEAIYLYFQSRPNLAGQVTIDNIAGHIGTLFENNIIVWRILGLLILMAAAVLFGLSFVSFSALLLPKHICVGDAPWCVAYVVVGALFYYAIGPPSFSYNIASNAGVLATFGALFMAAQTSRYLPFHAWCTVSSFSAVIMLSGRPSIIAIYWLLFSPVFYLTWCRSGLAPAINLMVWHGIYVLGGVLLIAYAVVGLSNVKDIYGILAFSTTSGSYEATSVISLHVTDILTTVIEAGRLAGIALLASAVIAGVLFLVCKVFSPLSGGIALWGTTALILVHISVLFPALVLWDYWQLLPYYESVKEPVCDSNAPVLVCPPGEVVFGARLIHVLSAQLLCITIIVVGEALKKQLQGGGAFGDWQSQNVRLDTIAVLVLFLAMATPAGSFYTNNNWFDHSIMGMGPLCLASFVALRTAPIANRVPLYLPSTLIALLGVIALVFILHNHVWYPYRVIGSWSEQSVKLETPATLNGLYVHPTSARLIEQTREYLERGGFQSEKDVLVAAYRMPGLVVALEARALGNAWLHYGYENIDEANCLMINNDPIDIGKIGRVFLLTNTVIPGVLRECLLKRGIDIDDAQSLGDVPVRPGHKVSVSVVRYVAENKVK